MATATASDRISEFLEASPIPLYIGGKWVAARGGETIDVTNPADGSRLATVSGGGPADIDAAVKAAWAAFPKWSAMPANDRAVLIHRLADLIDKNTAEQAWASLKWPFKVSVIRPPRASTQRHERS